MFWKKDECEKICSQIYDDVGIKHKPNHTCKYDHDKTYTCSVPLWLDRYVR